MDGQPAELLRANTAFLGLELDAGEHVIELHYETPGLKVGLVLSGAGILAFVGIVIWHRRRRNPAKPAGK